MATRTPIPKGQRFGRLTVEGIVSRGRHGRTYFCRCSCGGAREVLGHHLKQGGVTRCGCGRTTRPGPPPADAGIAGNICDYCGLVHTKQQRIEFLSLLISRGRTSAQVRAAFPHIWGEVEEIYSTKARMFWRDLAEVRATLERRAA